MMVTPAIKKVNHHIRYFSREPDEHVDHAFIEALYGSKKALSEHDHGWQGRKTELPVLHAEMGNLLADENGIGLLIEKFERRCGRESLERKRKDDNLIEPIEKIIQEIARMHKVDWDKPGFDTREGQKVRRILLRALKDLGGLKYRENTCLPEFAGVKMNSLGSMYRHEKMGEK